MSIFNFKDEDALGRVRSVDTATVVVHVDDAEKLKRLQVNRLAVLQSSKAGHHLIGIIQKITRNSVRNENDETEDGGVTLNGELNLVKITLIGTMADRVGESSNVFLRTLERVPDIDACCFEIEGQSLTNFMRVVSNVAIEGQKLSLGTYTLDDGAEAFLNGNKFFQRHAIIVGSTGSGKSWTTARVLEQLAELPNGNAIVFDIHGEYTPLQGDGVKHFKIAGPTDLDSAKVLSDGVIHLPYWLLAYDALMAMFIDRSDQNAPNQAMIMSRTIIEAKKAYLIKEKHEGVLKNFTIDSPIPFSLTDVIRTLTQINEEMIPGAKIGTEKQGDFNGKLSRLIQRLQSKQTDRRLGFLFQAPPETMAFDWLNTLVESLLVGTIDQANKKGGVKIIDFSEVPSDVLPLIVSLVARLAFSVQQWTDSRNRHPIALFCDEAHLYIPERQTAGADTIAVQVFERIAKEGRKYGIGLVVISQRPSEVNRTVLSQCNNLVSMRLTNGDDQSVVRKLLPDSLGGFGELLPVLDTGEALVVGDASLLPTRIRVTMPSRKPNSGTVQFWDKWAVDSPAGKLNDSVANWRNQSMQ